MGNVCKTTGKVRYRSRVDAVRQMGHMIRTRSVTNTATLQAYWHDDCHSWHLGNVMWWAKDGDE